MQDTDLNTAAGGDGPSTGRVDREAEWKSRLAKTSSAAIVFLAASGFVVWLTSFGRLLEITLLAHTIVGLLAVTPVLAYLIRHWLLYRRHLFTAVKLFGYLTSLLVLACGVSGIILTGESLFGTRIDYFCRAVHRWTTVGIVAFILPHVLLIVARDWNARTSGAMRAAWAAMKSYGVAVAGTSGLLCVATLLITYLYEPPHLISSFPKDYELWQPKSSLYANNRPFAPSLARTKGNAPLDDRLLSGSRSCGTMGCHEQIVKEWLPSAHRYAAMDKTFQAIQLTMAKQNGPVSTRYCAGCHDPISLFSGTKNIDRDEKNLTGLHGFQEGISCLSCHSIRETDIKGNAHYTMERPPRYVGELEFDAGGGTGWKTVRDFLIRSYPNEHVAGLSKVMFKKPEYCAACHKQFVDEEVNKVGWVQLQNQYDNWKASKWARGDKAEKILECRECHMPLVKSTDPAAGDSHDYNRTPTDGMHRSHRFIAANTLMPSLLGLEGADEQTRLTNRWLQGHVSIPEIAKKWAPEDAPAVSIQLIAPAEARAREQIKVTCIITSNKVGHDFPTGPLDIIQSWIELVVRDAAGQIVYESGTVDDKGFIKPGAFMFKSEPVDQYGNLIDRHNLWEMVGVRQRRSLFPGFSDQAEFAFVCPSMRRSQTLKLPQQAPFEFQTTAPGRLDIIAKLRYRKVDQFLLNYLESVGFFAEFKDKGLTAPITDMHEQHAVVRVVQS